MDEVLREYSARIAAIAEGCRDHVPQLSGNLSVIAQRMFQTARFRKNAIEYSPKEMGELEASEKRASSIGWQHNLPPHWTDTECKEYFEARDA